MRPGSTRRGGAILIAPLLLLGTLLSGRSLGDEPGLLNRLFHLGISSTPSPSAAPRPRDPAPVFAPPTPAQPPTVAEPPTPQPRIVPLPRVSRPVTEADPIVTRVVLGRSSTGGQFGMFLQVFADGTVIDSAGAHSLGREAVLPVLDMLEAGDLYRLKGHCGAPSPDFIESVHMVVYERSRGRLRATSFSYSGNPRGCDPAVQKLHALLDALQARISPPAALPATPVAEPTSPAVTAPTPVNRGPVIPLIAPQ